MWKTCRSRNHAAHGQALGAQAAAIAEQIQNRRDALNRDAGETKAALSARAPLVLEAAVALGRPHLKPWQYDVACRVASRQDAIAIRPAGDGKSLLVHLLAMQPDAGLILYILPLIALAVEQCDALNDAAGMERELVDGTMRPTAVVLGGENEADFHERIGTRPPDFQARRKATLCGEPEALCERLPPGSHEAVLLRWLNMPLKATGRPAPLVVLCSPEKAMLSLRLHALLRSASLLPEVPQLPPAPAASEVPGRARDVDMPSVSEAGTAVPPLPAAQTLSLEPLSLSPSLGAALPTESAAAWLHGGDASTALGELGRIDVESALAVLESAARGSERARVAGSEAAPEARAQRGRYTHLCVDEVHCVLDHGHTFRPEYLDLGLLRVFFPEVTVLLMTATANNDAIDAIKVLLRLGELYVHRAVRGSLRPQMRYRVLPVRNTRHKNEVLAALLSNRNGMCGIVYCDTQATTSRLARLFEPMLGGNVGFFHAGLSASDKRSFLPKWTSGLVRVVFATIALGMGMDKADVRFVIHYSPSQNVAAWYQESARAGRDGSPADEIVLYSSRDWVAAAQMRAGSVSRSADGRDLGLAQSVAVLGAFIQPHMCRHRVFEEELGDGSALEYAKCGSECRCPACQEGHTGVSEFLPDVWLPAFLAVLRQVCLGRGSATLLQLHTAWAGAKLPGGCELEQWQRDVTYSRVARRLSARCPAATLQTCETVGGVCKQHRFGGAQPRDARDCTRWWRRSRRPPGRGRPQVGARAMGDCDAPRGGSAGARRELIACLRGGEGLRAQPGCGGGPSGMPWARPPRGPGSICSGSICSHAGERHTRRDG